MEVISKTLAPLNARSKTEVFESAIKVLPITPVLGRKWLALYQGELAILRSADKLLNTYNGDDPVLSYWDNNASEDVKMTINVYPNCGVSIVKHPVK